MRRPSLVWRLVQTVERLLPTSLREAAVAGAMGSTSARGRRWVALAVLPSMIFSVTQFVRARAALPEVWPVWRPLLIDLAAVVAGAVLVAGAISGIVAWCRVQRIAHA